MLTEYLLMSFNCTRNLYLLDLVAFLQQVTLRLCKETLCLVLLFIYIYKYMYTCVASFFALFTKYIRSNYHFTSHVFIFSKTNPDATFPTYVTSFFTLSRHYAFIICNFFSYVKETVQNAPLFPNNFFARYRSVFQFKQDNKF